MRASLISFSAGLAVLGLWQSGLLSWNAALAAAWAIGATVAIVAAWRRGGPLARHRASTQLP
jgi:hypothetical protein